MTEIDFSNPPTPYPYPLRMLDRLESLDTAAGKLLARKSVSRNEPLIQGHFPGFPILPGILQIEALAQASALLLSLVTARDPAKLCFIVYESRIKHLRPVLPGETMLLDTQLIARNDPFYTFKVRATVDTEEAAKGQIVLQWLASLAHLPGTHSTAEKSIA